jgi:NTE family protein
MRFVLLISFLCASSPAAYSDSSRVVKTEFEPVFAGTVGPPHYFLAHRQLRRPRIGLALSGGGARALAQVGVLRALEERGIPIDFIAGTSMGSVIGGLYAAGYSARQLMDITRNIPWGELMVDTPPRSTLFIAQKAERDRSYLQIRFNGLKPYIPPALTPGQKLIALLTDLTMRANYRASANFDNLRIPFRAVATDLFSGNEVIIADGDLAEALRASVAMPLLLAPVTRDSMLLVDGGLVDNIPVSVVRRHNIDIAIAVDATSKLRDRAELNAPWEVADQVTSIMQRAHNERQRQAVDVLIRLAEEQRTSMDFSNLDSLFEAGYRAALARMDEIEKKIAGANSTAQLADTIEIARVYVNGSLSDWPGAAKPAYSNGQATMEIRAPEIESMLAAHYSTGDYAAVRALVHDDPVAPALHVELTSNPILEAVSFSGNTVFSDSVLLRRMQSPLGKPINHLRSHEDLQTIIELYRSSGYALAEIRQASFDRERGALNIDIDEGYIADIKIEGAQRTKSLVILREFPLKVGDIFDSNRSAAGIQNIHSLGLFDRVAINVTRRPDATSDRPSTAVIHIKLEEKPFQLVRLGARYDTERFGRLWLELGDENLLGLASQFLAHGVVGSKDNAAILSWRVDRLLRTYLSFSAQARYRYSKHFTYDGGPRAIGEYEDRRYGAFFSIGQQVRRFGAVSAEVDLSTIRRRGIHGTGYPVGRESLNTLTFRSVVDTQDRVPFARRGRFAHLAYTMALGELQSEPSFFKFIARLEASATLRKRHTLNPRFMAGTSDQFTPFSEQFRLGGQEEFYGLHDQELIGRHFVLMSLEYRYRFPTKFIFDTYLSPRIDFGAVWRDKNDVNYRKFKRALGVSLGWDSPLGPILLAIGKMEQRRYRFTFSAGFRF